MRIAVVGSRGQLGGAVVHELGRDHDVTPLDRAGLYVPGGKAAYPSSVLMNALPAKVAGVRELIMVVPTPDGEKNELVLAAAAPGSPPIVGTADPADMTDPLPQAMILTAIVITRGMTAFLLALAYRSWRLSGHDEVQDDAEDRRVRELAERDEGSDTEDLDAAEGVRG